MATLSHFHSLLSLSSRNFSFLDQLHTQNHHPKFHCLGHLHPRRQSYVCTCSISNSRASRRKKSNEELCNDIREFIRSVGLPEDHVPSTKELSQHGRTDLANIVRRRGHKHMRELLLANSTTTVEGDCDLGNITLTGQDGEAEDVVEDLVLENPSHSSNTNHVFSFEDCISDPTTTANSSEEEELSTDLICHDEYNASYRENDENIETVEADKSRKTEVAASEDCFTSSDIGLGDTCSDRTGELIEFSKNLSVENDENSLECQSEVTNNKDDESSWSLEVISEENYLINSTADEYLDMHDHDEGPLLLTPSSSSKEEALYYSNEQVEKEDNCVDGVSLSAEMTIIDDRSSGLNIDRALAHEDSSDKLVKYSEELSLAEKVARFIQNGDLDIVDDNFDATLSESGAGKGNGSVAATNAEESEINFHVEAFSEDTTASRGSLMASNGSASEFDDKVSTTTVGQLIRDNQPSTEALNGQIEKVSGAEIKVSENQVEIDRLKFMLHQKELELSQLKEQIERDKLALSASQSKAEAEISLAQKLILERDSELVAAEECLYGLEEVQIHYSGEGEIVEVAGSFNGWHHKIKMDPQPSSNHLDSVNSKKHRHWSTVLWLYPGVYEIKFVVDGHWKIDPHRESLTKGAISNNILRVGR
ncbi:protein PTST homolog 3, chloroplastic isoform X2 [Cucumis sativus]|uniref:AMP-activated protein kinase glycogen-binding domain-containing protein n=1 Tax=Cucumis sativus TaxID=3659 RepID=A0A0A0KF60_CUCSA|nr:protein PTST homolog 3, chloroplastic isoform X2 [Cucumis sativus]